MTSKMFSVIAVFVAVALTTLLVQASLAPSHLFTASLIAMVPIVCFLISLGGCLALFSKSSNG